MSFIYALLLLVKKLIYQIMSNTIQLLYEIFFYAMITKIIVLYDHFNYTLIILLLYNNIYKVLIYL